MISEIRSKLRKVVHHRFFSTVICVLILLNALLIGLETYPAVFLPYQQEFFFLDKTLLLLFTVEIGMRMASYDNWKNYFKDGWNLFDLGIVVSGYVFSETPYVTIFRIFRVLRILRAISVIPSLRRLVKALLVTIPQLGNILLLLGITFYVFSVIGTTLFREYSPEYFGSLHASLLTLFQVITLEAWASGVMRPLMESAPWAWAYFVVFILIGTFVVLNLFVGVIVTKVDEVEKRESTDEIKQELAILRKEVQDLRRLLINKSSNERG